MQPARRGRSQVDADTTALQTELRAAASLGRQFSNSLVNAFEGIAIKGAVVADVLKGLALRLSELVLRAAFKPLEQGFGSVFQGLLSGGLGFAKGGGIPGRHAGAVRQRRRDLEPDRVSTWRAGRTASPASAARKRSCR